MANKSAKRNINLPRWKRKPESEVDQLADRLEPFEIWRTMKLKFSYLFPLALLFSILMALTPFVPVYAQAVVSISPTSITNDVATIVTVTGSGFDATAKILLDGVELPGTVLVNDTTLQVTVPAGVALGSHIITVSQTGATGSVVLSVTAPVPTAAPLPTATTAPAPFARPQIVVRTSRAVGTVETGKEFTLKIVIENAGSATAYNTQAVFASADLVPSKTGGVSIIGQVAYDDEVDVAQTFYVSGQLTGKSLVVVDMTITYYDDKGATYSDKFTLSVSGSGASTSGGGGAAYATATPTSVKSSQLVISSYSADVDPLQPGMQFALKMKVQNVGNAKAQRITMIVGGGSSGTSGGTPQPGGVSGGSGDFANFAPVGASNVQSLGDLKAGDTSHASQNLIVNVSTNPGAYPMKVTFSYLNDQGETINDEQVITLLVYSLPSVDVSFYRPLDPLYVGQPGALPIQVVNLGKRAAVLGNIKLSASSGQIENGTSLVGSLDPGGYFTLDFTFTPEQSGKQSLDVTIEYVDDFNQPRTVTKKLDIEVQEGSLEPTPDPSMSGGGGGGGGSITSDETALHKIFRFIKGLFGLDSAWPVWQAPGSNGQPQFEQPIIAPAGGKGG